MADVIDEVQDGPVATGDTVTVSDKVELPEYSDKLNITVPKDARPDSPRKAGEKYQINFSFGQVENDEQAQAVCAAKDWSLVKFVNEALKYAARSAAYQRELALYRESEMTPEKARERLIRAFIKQGVPEDVATKMVDATLENKA